MLSCLLQEESTFLLHISVQRAPGPDAFAVSGERVTLIFPDSIKRGHNRGRCDRPFEILSTVSVGRLQTAKIDEAFNRLNIIAVD